ncbi:MAG: hypothetical protein J6S44_04325 [Clostridia bacterium]|nr:hypothetical protein [Clostridia bacterium]
MLKKEEIQGKFFMRLTMSILILPVLALFLVGMHYLTRALTDEGEIFHWLPIAISAVAFFFGGAFVGVPSYKTAHWTEEVNGRPCWQYPPIGKTEAELDAFVKKNFKKDGFATSDLTIVICFLVLDLIILGMGVFFSMYTINALVAFPLWVISALVFRLPTGSGYAGEAFGSDWNQYLCPHCKAICGKLDYKTANHKEANWIGSKQVKVTDKYTNGVDTFWVDRVETKYTLNQHTSFDKIYTCSRCKKTHVKKFSHTQEL